MAVHQCRTHLDCDARVGLILDYVLCDALVDHAERALAQLPQQLDLVPRDLPLIREVHWQRVNKHTILYRLHGRYLSICKFVPFN